MKKSTTVATMANGLLKVLQRYTKGIRLVAVLTMLFTVGVGSMLGAATTYTFTTKSWGDSNNGWTSGKDGNDLTKNQGVQVTTGVSGANATTKTSFTNVSSVAVQYCTNAKAGTGTIKIQVGSNSAQSFSVSAPSSGGTTLKTKTFTFSPNQTGTVKISVDCTKNSVYIYSVTITTTDAVTCDTAPTVSAASNSNVSTTSATVSCSGGITSLGSTGCSITSYGFVYGTSTDPTISNTKVQVGTSYTTTGTSFSKSITGLSANTTYYVRPYATNGYGTAYGTQTSFTTKELTKYTVNWYVNRTKEHSQTDVAGATLTDIPTPTTADCDNSKVFVGWVTSGINEPTNIKPDFVTPTTIPSSNTDYYAVFATLDGEGGGSGTPETATVTSTEIQSTYETNEKTTKYGSYSISTTIGVWTGFFNTSLSSTIYSVGIKEAKEGNTRPYLLSPTYSGGITNITFIVSNASAQNTRTIYICSGSTSDPSNDNIGHGTVNAGASQQELSIDVSDSPEQIYVYASVGAVSIQKITVTYGGGSTPSYSGYTTSCTTETARCLTPKCGVTVAARG